MGELIHTWSFSRLKDFEKCPYMAFLKYSEKRPTDHMDRTAADRGTMIHEEAEKFVKGEGDLTKNLSKFRNYFATLKHEYAEGHVEIEENWGFTVDWTQTGWWDDDVWCRMKLDNFRHQEFGDDGHSLIVATATDYKTGKKFGNEVTHNQQGQLYALGSFLRYPTLEVVNVQFIYLDHGQDTRKVYTREKAMKFLGHWTDRAKKMTGATDFPPKPNKQTCMWCPFGPQNGDGSCEWGV